MKSGQTEQLQKTKWAQMRHDAKEKMRREERIKEERRNSRSLGGLRHPQCSVEQKTTGCCNKYA